MKSSLLFSFCLLFLVACKKIGSNPIDYGQGTGHCRISDIGFSPYQPDSVHLLYDQADRLVKVDFWGLNSYILSYKGDTVFTQTIDTSGKPQLFDTTVFNNGAVVFQAFGTYRGAASRSKFFYDGNGIMTMRQISGQDEGVNYYTWANGDLVRDSVKGASYSFFINYEYDTTKADQYASQGTRECFLRYSAPIFRNKHLLKSMTYSNGNKDVYSYTFDADNKVRKMMINSKDTAHYTYQCQWD